MANDITCMVQGRLVYVIGDLFKGDTAMTYGTKAPKLNKAGQTYKEYGFGLAVPKSVLSQTGVGQPGEIWTKIHEAAYTIYPNRQIPANFHMKYKDGDTGTNQDGTPVNTKEGYPGHVVFNMKTTIPIKFFRYENGQNIQINEGIKCGDYVNVQVSINAHAGVNAGLYLNPNAVQFLGYGKEIVNAPTGNTIFGAVAPQVPQGASMTPIAPAGLLVPTQQFGQPAMGAVMAPTAPAAPHFGVLPQQFQQPPQQQPAMPAMPPMPGFPQQ